MAVDVRALRAMLAPEIRIAPGRALMARVVATGAGGRGSLSIAGLLVDAQLPDSVTAGDQLRLIVASVDAERVLLTISTPGGQDPSPPGAAGGQPAGAQPGAHEGAPSPGSAAAAQPASPPPVVGSWVPLPGGGRLSVLQREAGGGAGAEGARTLALRYDAPALGPIDLRFTLAPGALALHVTVASEALAAARAAGGELERSLAGALSRPATVTVSARGEPLDVYA